MFNEVALTAQPPCCCCELPVSNVINYLQLSHRYIVGKLEVTTNLYAYTHVQYIVYSNKLYIMLIYYRMSTYARTCVCVRAKSDVNLLAVFIHNRETKAKWAHVSYNVFLPNTNDKNKTLRKLERSCDDEW